MMWGRGRGRGKDKGKAVAKPKRGSGLNASGQLLHSQIGITAEHPSLSMGASMEFVHKTHAGIQIKPNNYTQSDSYSDFDEEGGMVNEDGASNSLWGNEPRDERLNLPQPTSSRMVFSSGFSELYPSEIRQNQGTQPITSSSGSTSHTLMPSLYHAVPPEPSLQLPQLHPPHTFHEPTMLNTLSLPSSRVSHSHFVTNGDTMGYNQSNFPFPNLSLFGPHLQHTLSTSLSHGRGRSPRLSHYAPYNAPMRPGEHGVRGSIQVISNKTLRTVSVSRKQVLLPPAPRPQAIEPVPSNSNAPLFFTQPLGPSLSLPGPNSLFTRVPPDSPPNALFAAAKIALFYRMITTNLLPGGVEALRMAEKSIQDVCPGAFADSNVMKKLVESLSHLRTTMKEDSKGAIDWYELCRPRDSLFSDPQFKIWRLSQLKGTPSEPLLCHLHIPGKEPGEVFYYEHLAIENLIHDTFFSGNAIFPNDVDCGPLAPHIGAMIAAASTMLEFYLDNFPNGYYHDAPFIAVVHAPKFDKHLKLVKDIQSGSKGSPEVQQRFLRLCKSIFQRGIDLKKIN